MLQQNQPPSAEQIEDFARFWFIKGQGDRLKLEQPTYQDNPWYMMGWNDADYEVNLGRTVWQWNGEEFNPIDDWEEVPPDAIAETRRTERQYFDKLDLSDCQGNNWQLTVNKFACLRLKDYRRTIWLTADSIRDWESANAWAKELLNDADVIENALSK